VANARQCQEYLIEQDKLPPHKVRFISNGLELDRFSPGTSPDRKSFLPANWQDKLIVGTIGALADRKSPETFVQVAARILKDYEHVRFIHAGDGPLKGMVEHLSQELAIRESILFLGPRRDAPDVLRAMDIFLLTSRNEGMPNVVMEAMATALPCVVTDIGDCKDLVLDGETGYVVPVGDVIRLSERVRDLIENESIRHAMGQQGHQIIQAYDVHKMAEQYRLLYDEVLAPAAAVT
jgi:glycosyltransferase involved in cell wall biosynthesis